MDLNITFFLDYYQPPIQVEKYTDSPTRIRHSIVSHTRTPPRPHPPRTKHLSVNQVPPTEQVDSLSFSLPLDHSCSPSHTRLFFNSDSFRQMRSPGMSFARKTSKEIGR